MARRTLIINGVLVVAVVVVGVIAYSWLHTTSKATAARQTTTVTQGDVTSTVSASGNVASAVNLGVSFSGCSGTLTSVAVKAGDKVTVGQTLATVDNTTATAAVATAQTTLSQAQASLASSIAAAKTSLTNAQNSYNLDVQQGEAALATANAAVPVNQNSVTQATNSLASTKLKDQQQINSAQTALTQAEASTSQQQTAVNTAQTAVNTTQANLTNCTLTSPVAATVITVNGTVGATPGSGSVASSSSSSSSSSTGTGTGSNSSSSSSSSTAASTATSSVSTSSGFITLADMSKLIIPGTVTESDIANVKTGEAVSVVFAALTDATHPSGTTVPGTISSVDLTSTVSSSVVSYGVTISLTSPPANVRLGQSGTATITTSSKQNVVRVASNAITTLGPVKTATIVTGKTTQVVTVTTGLTGNGETEVDSGLKAGDVVELPSTTGTTNTFNLLGGGGTGTLLGGGR